MPLLRIFCFCDLICEKFAVLFHNGLGPSLANSWECNSAELATRGCTVTGWRHIVTSPDSAAVAATVVAAGFAAAVANTSASAGGAAVASAVVAATACQNTAVVMYQVLLRQKITAAALLVSFEGASYSL